MNKELIFGVAASALVLSGTIIALTVTGSPGYQRSIVLDERRLDDVEHLASAIQARYDKEPLPRALPPDIVKSDPATNEPYEYRLVNPKKYQLCVHFDEASPRHSAEDDNPYLYRRWRNHHAAGHVCFSFKKNTEYPIKLDSNRRLFCFREGAAAAALLDRPTGASHAGSSEQTFLIAGRASSVQ